MKVRALISRYRGIKYKIDGILYKSSMYIPEIIRDRTIDTYGLLDGVMVIRTKHRVKNNFIRGVLYDIAY